MSVEEINKQLNTQEKLSRLSTEDQKKAQAAIDAGLDITNINDEQLMQEVQKAAAQKAQNQAAAEARTKAIEDRKKELEEKNKKILEDREAAKKAREEKLKVKPIN
jgi:hypothetical protein